MLKRKIYDKLVEWKNSSNGITTLLIKETRRIGMSFIVEEFAKKSKKLVKTKSLAGLAVIPP